MKSDNKIIGGMFGLPQTLLSDLTVDTGRWLFLRDSNLFLANARSGILILIDLLKPCNVWMPSYLCPTMVEAVDQKKTGLKFYEIDYNLRIPSVDWTQQIQADDIVVFIDYFGFPLDANVVDIVKKQGGWILEDACQALLSEHVGAHSDFVLFSPRKFIGIPDGGVLVSCCDVSFDNVDLQPTPTSWWMKTLEAAINRREFDKYGGKRRWYQLFQETKSIMPCGYFTMSDLSKKLLFQGFDYSKTAHQRIENYLVLANELKEIALFPELSQGTVPIGFPVILNKRDQILQKLFRHEIYPPVHWSIRDTVPCKFEDSHRLSATIATLLCDQRYGEANMERISRIMLGELEC